MYISNLHFTSFLPTLGMKIHFILTTTTLHGDEQPMPILQHSNSESKLLPPTYGVSSEVKNGCVCGVSSFKSNQISSIIPLSRFVPCASAAIYALSGYHLSPTNKNVQDQYGFG